MRTAAATALLLPILLLPACPRAASVIALDDASDAAPAADARADAVRGPDAAPPLVDAGPDAVVVREFDLGQEFSATNAAPGVWRIGWQADTSLARASFALEVVHVDVGNIHFWHPGADFAGYYPYVAGNATAATTTDASRSWAVRAGELALEGSNTGQHAMVQFVAPDAGVYRVRADFAGLHFRLSTTDVHVLRGDAPLFDALIDGYGGDPALHAIEGASPNASYAGTVALAAGDTLGFAIGYGANMTYNNDTTGLIVHVEELR